jgi:hypothetical protein
MQTGKLQRDLLSKGWNITMQARGKKRQKSLDLKRWFIIIYKKLEPKEEEEIRQEIIIYH